jgi:hypothetical protein
MKKPDLQADPAAHYKTKKKVGDPSGPQVNGLPFGGV